MPKYEIDRKFNLILQIESIRWIVSSFLQFLLKNIKNRGGVKIICVIRRNVVILRNFYLGVMLGYVGLSNI